MRGRLDNERTEPAKAAPANVHSLHIELGAGRRKLNRLPEGDVRFAWGEHLEVDDVAFAHQAAGRQRLSKQVLIRLSTLIMVIILE